MKKRRSIWLLGALLALIPFQNCGQGFQSIDASSAISTASSNGDPAGGGDTTPPPPPTGTGKVCMPADVGMPAMSPSSTTAVQVLSGTGANGGQVASPGFTIGYTASNAAANCSQTVNVQCQVVSQTVTAIDTSGNRLPVANGDITCRATPGTVNPGATVTMSFVGKDNDTDKQCFQGTATYKISLRSSADTSKFSNSQTVTVNFKDNCYPEQTSNEGLDSFDQMGTAVAVDGSTAAVLAPGDDGVSNGTANIGAIYIYQRTGANSWTKSQVLRTDDTSIVSDRGAAGDTPGSLALKNGVLVVGSEFSNNNAGAIYVFKSAGGGFSLSRKISGNVTNGKFGRAVAVDSSQIAVGAPGEANSAGAVYIYDVNTLSQAAMLNSPLPANSFFGASVAIENSLLAVGAPGSTLYRDTMTGEVLLFQKGGSWAEISANPLRSNASKTNLAIKDSAGKAGMLTLPMGSELGNAVSILNGVVLVGAPGYSAAMKKPGIAILIGADHTSLQTLADFSNTDLARYGTSVSLSSGGAFVGAPEIRTRAGAVDHFVMANGVYALSRRMISHTSAANDQFGFSVSASGNNVVVGAKLNADPNNASGSASFFSTIVP